MDETRGSLLSEQAYRKIKWMIVSLRLAPTATVRESELRQELGMGRTPIREALQRLALEQLITIIPRQGIFVTEVAPADLQHIFEIRLSLEPLASRLAARRGQPHHWSSMRQALAGYSLDSGEMDNETLIRVDDRCHQIIYQASGNRFLQRTAATLYACSLRLWYFSLSQIGDMRHAVGEHVKILDALELGDEARAASLLEGHLRAFHDEIQAALVAAPPLTPSA